MTGLLAAMTLPGLVLLLLAAGVVEQVVSRQRRRRTGQPMTGGFTGAGLDVLQAALYPEKRHQVEELQSERMRRDDEDDGAPPHSTVDLDAGIARLRVPPRRFPT
jgi:hypothetical protein